MDSKHFSACHTLFPNLPVAGFTNPRGVPEAPEAISPTSIRHTDAPFSNQALETESPAKPAPNTQKSKEFERAKSSKCWLIGLIQRLLSSFPS